MNYLIDSHLKLRFILQFTKYYANWDRFLMEILKRGVVWVTVLFNEKFIGQFYGEIDHSVVIVTLCYPPFFIETGSENYQNQAFYT